MYKRPNKPFLFNMAHVRQLPRELLMLILEEKTNTWKRQVNEEIKFLSCECEDDFEHHYHLRSDKSPATEFELENFDNARDIVYNRDVDVICVDCVMFCDMCEFDCGDRIEELRDAVGRLRSTVLRLRRVAKAANKLVKNYNSNKIYNNIFYIVVYRLR
jgi:hypothetical protein